MPVVSHKSAAKEAGRLEDAEQKERILRDQTHYAAQEELLRKTGGKEVVRAQEQERRCACWLDIRTPRRLGIIRNHGWSS